MSGPDCLHALIKAQAAARPDAVAVSCSGTDVTYRDLQCRADRLARELRRVNVGAEVPVGLFVDHSVDMVVGILGILGAGGAYVPLDPKYPADHLTFILDDARNPVVVLQRRLANRAKRWSRPVSLVSIGGPGEEPDDSGATGACNPDTLAYIMYTSGSTGTSKGVMVTHRALAYSTAARLAVYRAPVESLVLLPSFAFDASVASIFWTLSTGGRLVLPQRGADRDPVAIGRLIQLERVSHILCTSSLYLLILHHADPLDLASLQVAVVGGEVCSPVLARRHREVVPSARLYNEYGPTECTVWSAVCDVTSQSDDATVPIGRPIPGTEIHILDAAMERVPQGATGEIFIGGPGIARGYLNRPDLTASHFVPDPFGGGPSARLFKTGDLGRYLPDGQVEFLGRRDNQIKIRGHRVELEQVEAVLRQHAAVRHAAVVAVDDTRGAKRLVGYVAGRSRPALVPADVRSFLKAKLPSFMVPSELVVLDELPLTVAGKVDRCALPPPTASRASTRPDLHVLRPLEAQLRSLWEEMLGVEPVGLDENFFELGGHSLLAAELLARVNEMTGRALPLAALLDAPNIRQMAALLERPALTQDSSPLVPVQRQGKPPAFFFVPGGGQSALIYEPLARHLGTGRPVYALVPDLADWWHASCRIEGLAARFVAELEQRQPTGPFMLGGNSLGGLVAFEMARQLEARGRCVELLALFDTPNPGSLSDRFRFIGTLLGEGARPGTPPPASQPTKGRLVLNTPPAAIGFGRFLGWLAASCLRSRPRPVAFNHAAYQGYAQGLAYLRYSPRAAPSRLVLFRAATTRAGYPATALLGWDRLTRNVEVHEMPGDHLTMLRDPHVSIVAGRLRALLASLNGKMTLVDSRPVGAVSA